VVRHLERRPQLTARNAAGSVLKRLEVTITPATLAPPKLDSFVGTPASVAEGETTALSFTAQNADSVLPRDGQGRAVLQQDTGGAPSVMQSNDIVPDRTEAFALTLTNAGGQVTQAVTVQVIPATPTPEPTPAPTETPAPPESHTRTPAWRTPELRSGCVCRLKLRGG
jgi:hypothetical protein